MNPAVKRDTLRKTLTMPSRIHFKDLFIVSKTMTTEDKILQYIARHKEMTALKPISIYAGVSEKETSDILNKLIHEGKVGALNIVPIKGIDGKDNFQPYHDFLLNQGLHSIN